MQGSLYLSRTCKKSQHKDFVCNHAKNPSTCFPEIGQGSEKVTLTLSDYYE